MATTNAYLKTVGLGVNLESPFSQITGKISTNTGTDRINQSLMLILETDRGEVPMLQVLGSNLDYHLFEPNDEVLKEMVALAIRDAIDKLEPRITVQDIVITPDEHYVNVIIRYVIRNTNIAGTFNYNLTRGNGGDTDG